MMELLGLRADLAVAAAFGAAFLVLSRNLTPRQSMAAVAGGIGTAAYFTPILVPFIAYQFEWFAKIPVLFGERAAAFLWGLGGSFFLAGLIVLGERFRKDPINTAKDLKP